MNKYGYFSKDGKEFTVTRYDTPLPWTNYLSNGNYCAIVSSTGGGFSFYKSHHANCILRREQRNLINDRPGRYVYIYDKYNLQENNYKNYLQYHTSDVKLRIYHPNQLVLFPIAFCQYFLK